MSVEPQLSAAARWAAAGAALAAVAGVTSVGITWMRYGKPARAAAEERDELLDRFMPTFDVVERHRLGVRAPAAVTLAVAREMKLSSRPVIRAVFKARELMLGARPDRRQRPTGLIAEVLSLGWGVLAETTGREIVVGAVTKPWEADVTFRSLPPEAFAAFDEPGFVKIAWTLRADALDATTSIFRTETRAVGTDAAARRTFRGYWAFVAPGIRLIRRMSLAPIRADAERRARLGLRVADGHMHVADGY